MADSSHCDRAGPDAAGRRRQVSSVSATRTWRQKLSFGNIGAVYVWILIIVIFSIAVPEHFLIGFTPRNIVNNYTISGLAALAVLIPMASGAFDASIGGNMSLSGVICAYLLLHTALPVGVVVLITLGAGLAIGLFNVLVVVVLGISSLIGTLATFLIELSGSPRSISSCTRWSTSSGFSSRCPRALPSSITPSPMRPKPEGRPAPAAHDATTPIDDYRRGTRRGPKASALPPSPCASDVSAYAARRRLAARLSLARRGFFSPVRG